MITLKQFLTIVEVSVAEIADYSTVGRMGDQGTIGVTASWQVPEAEKPIRAGAFARRCLPHLSRREIGQAIRDRLFRVHGKTVKKGDQLSAGNRLDFVGPPSWLAVRPVPNERLRVPIVYEDPALLIVDARSLKNVRCLYPIAWWVAGSALLKTRKPETDIVLRCGLARQKALKSF